MSANAIERLRTILFEVFAESDHEERAAVTADLAAVEALLAAAKRVVDSPFRRTPDGTGEALAAAVRRVESGQ